MSGSDSVAAGLVQATSPVDGVRLLALNRSSKRNALSGQLIAEFLGALSTASTDPGVKAIVITGNGPFFCGMYFRTACNTHTHTHTYGQTPISIYLHVTHGLLTWNHLWHAQNSGRGSQRHRSPRFGRCPIVSLPGGSLLRRGSRPQARDRGRQWPSGETASPLSELHMPRLERLPRADRGGVVSLAPLAAWWRL